MQKVTTSTNTTLYQYKYGVRIIQSTSIYVYSSDWAHAIGPGAFDNAPYKQVRRPHGIFGRAEKFFSALGPPLLDVVPAPA